MNYISWQDYERVDLRVGKIIAVDDFPEARKPAYKVTVDLGEEIGHKRSSAQLTANYEKEELIHKRVICVVNFPPKQIGPFMSEVLLTGFPDEDGEVVLATVDAEVPNGGKLF